MRSKVEISKRLILSGSVSSLLALFVNAGLFLWLNQYLLRRISPDEYSLYPLVMSIMAILMIFKVVLNSSNSRFVTEAYARGDIDAVTRISSTTFMYCAIAGLLLLGGGGWFCWRIDRILVVAPRFVSEARIMTAIIILSLAVGILTSPFEAGITIKQKYVTINIIEVLAEMFRVILLAALILGVSTRVLWIVAATESAKMLSTALRISISLKLVPALRFSPSRVDFRQSRQLLSFGGWSLVGDFMSRIDNSSDPIILNQLATPIDIACFNIGTLFSRQIARGWVAATNSIEPSLIAMHATDQVERLRNTFVKFGRIAVWAYMLLALPLMIYASDFTQLYVGNEFIAAVPVIILVLAKEIPGLGISMVSQLSNAKARVKSCAIRAIIVQIANVGLTLYFVGALRMGALGSALGSLVSTVIIRNALFIPFGLRLADVDVRTWLARTVVPGFLPGIAGTAAWLGLKLLHPPRSWLELIAFGAAGAVVYLFVLLRFSMQPDDKQDIKTLFPFLAIFRRKAP